MPKDELTVIIQSANTLGGPDLISAEGYSEGLGFLETTNFGPNATVDIVCVWHQPPPGSCFKRDGSSFIDICYFLVGLKQSSLITEISSMKFVNSREHLDQAGRVNITLTKCEGREI